MPDRPGLDDDARLQAIIDLWADGQADLDSRLAVIAAQIQTELGRDTLRLGRLRAAQRRLEELQDVAGAITDDLAQSTRTWLQGGGMARPYAAGATVAQPVGWSYTAPHVAAVGVLAADTYADVLAATQFVDDDTKRVIRLASRQLTARKLTGGQAVTRVSRQLADLLQGEGIGQVVYRNGARHPVSSYAEMLLRTKTGVAYNAGTLNQSMALGIEVVEILDGSDCGLTAHTDPVRASGMLVPLRVANDWPLSHPRCRRAFAPRPDIKASDIGAPFESVVSPEARADQTAFEDALAQQGERRSRRRAKAPKQPKDRTRTARTR